MLLIFSLTQIYHGSNSLSIIEHGIIEQTLYCIMTEYNICYHKYIVLILSRYSERLESRVSDLHEELSTTRDELNITKDEHEQTEIEFEKQQNSQTQIVKEFNEKETRWKNR